jgi:hypothetical protein
MGNCVYCQESAGFLNSAHNECKTSHWESAIPKMKNLECHVLVVPPDANEPLKEPQVAPTADWLLELLDNTFLKRPDEKWIYVQDLAVMWPNEVQRKITTNDSLGLGGLIGQTHGNIEEKDNFKKRKTGMVAFSNRAIHAQVEEQHWRFDFDKVIQFQVVSEWAETPSEGFSFGLSDSIGNQPQQFRLHTTNSKEAIPSQEELIRWLINEASQTDTQRGPLADTGASEESSNTLAGELSKLATLLEKGLLTEEEFGVAKSKLLS